MRKKQTKTKRDILPLYSNRTTPPLRVIIDSVTPQIDGGKFPIKRTVGEKLKVEATLLCDGHDVLKGNLLYRKLSEKKFQKKPLRPLGNDRWQASIVIETFIDYEYTVEASIDRLSSWYSDFFKKAEAGLPTHVDLQVGIELLFRAEGYFKKEEKLCILKKRTRLEEFKNRIITPSFLSDWWDDDTFQNLIHQFPDPSSHLQYVKTLLIQVDPVLATFSSWYEFFPRSFGTLQDTEKILEYVSALGFHIAYLPPIHPIGESFRKGKNNALQAQADDLGSPWAIGSPQGGHKSIHPDLGTFEDFERLLKKAHSLKIEIALDIAFQCSPDHPYVKEHPEWFKKRPDGTIQYAENPPKKYQDIFPFDFESEAWQALWAELFSILEFWIQKGIKVFRVDNPHTKSLRFWEWALQEIHKKYPEVIFLSEAFTRPHIMAYLAKVGFHQSYTYFSWRNTKQELTEYLLQLSDDGLRDTFRPNFWPNTPDILPERIQYARPSVFAQRLILAATLSSNYGIYGPPFELLENTPREQGSEEYLNSEKYQLRSWDLDDPQSLAPLIERMNRIRNTEPALQNQSTLQLHFISNDQLIAYSKKSIDGKKIIVCVVNLDPYHTQSAMLHLPIDQFEISPDEEFQVHDLLSNERYFWRGWEHYVELNPEVTPAHIFLIRKKSRTEKDFEYFQ
jgi:starch synthase (maltosyl-transferring)